MLMPSAPAVLVPLLLLSFIACWPTQVSTAAEGAQEPTTPGQPEGKPVPLEPVVVTATRTEMKVKEVPASVPVRPDSRYTGCCSSDGRPEERWLPPCGTEADRRN
jgi:outer membrane receptor protein involved in Fe transport